MREALRLATVDFLLSEVALVTVECASVIVVDEGRGGVEGGYWGIGSDGGGQEARRKPWIRGDLTIWQRRAFDLVCAPRELAPRELALWELALWPPKLSETVLASTSDDARSNARTR